MKKLVLSHEQKLPDDENENESFQKKPIKDDLDLTLERPFINFIRPDLESVYFYLSRSALSCARDGDASF